MGYPAVARFYNADGRLIHHALVNGGWYLAPESFVELICSLERPAATDHICLYGYVVSVALIEDKAAFLEWAKNTGVN